MIKYLLVAMFLVSGSAVCQLSEVDSSEGGAGIIYGSDHAFSLSAPKGWVLDNSAGVSQGMHAVFYPRGGSWKSSPTVMYANTSSKSSKGMESIQKLIAYDSSQFVQNQPGVQIINSDPLPTHDKKVARVKRFFYTNFEAVAYIDERTIVAMVVITARTKAEFLAAYPAFKELVASYFFLTTEVKIEGR